MILNHARKLFVSGYGRSIALLSGGQAVAAAIPIFAAPVLGRLYIPPDYGLLAIYIALAGIFAGASTLQYHHGVIAETSECRAEQMVKLSLLATLGVSAAACAVGVIACYLLGDTSNYSRIRYWVLFLPISTMSLGIIASAEALANRRRAFKSLASLQVAAALTTVITSIALGFGNWGVHGLFAGYFAGEAVRTAGYVRLLLHMYDRRRGTQWRQLHALARRHFDFPRFTLPAALISSLTAQIPTFTLGGLGATSLLGSFSRADRVVALPFLLIGTAASQVFRQRAADEWRRTGSCRRLFVRTALALAAVAIPPMAVLTLFGPHLFVLYLGPNWAEAGQIAQLLAPMLVLRIIASPLDQVLQFTGHQKTAFILNVLSAFLVFLGCIAPLITNQPDFHVVYGFTLSYSLIYILSFAASWRFSARSL